MTICNCIYLLYNNLFIFVYIKLTRHLEAFASLLFNLFYPQRVSIHIVPIVMIQIVHAFTRYGFDSTAASLLNSGSCSG